MEIKLNLVSKEGHEELSRLENVQNSEDEVFVGGLRKMNESLHKTIPMGRNECPTISKLVSKLT